MPYRSEKQARYFRLCAHNPSKATKKCPPKKVLREFEDAEQRKKGKR